MGYPSPKCASYQLVLSRAPPAASWLAGPAAPNTSAASWACIRPACLSFCEAIDIGDRSFLRRDAATFIERRCCDETTARAAVGAVCGGRRPRHVAVSAERGMCDGGAEELPLGLFVGVPPSSGAD